MAQRFSDIVVEIAKLRDYCLSDTHPRGRHKARVFRSRLGLTVRDADSLRQALVDAARDHQDDLRPTESDEFGQRYVLDFEMTTAAASATIRSAWIVLAGQDVLRLVSCYVL
ncbi:MAG TPA: hypothetical protein VK797_06950 [Tepidisphaeraceae bacterium]|nr:hypothetical protein [Tepidisphaeraceae bacterium]